MSKELFTLDCSIVRETDNAILVRTDEGDEVWLPLSQVDQIRRPAKGADTVVMTAWIAKMKGLI